MGGMNRRFPLSKIPLGVSPMSARRIRGSVRAAHKQGKNCGRRLRKRQLNQRRQWSRLRIHLNHVRAGPERLSGQLSCGIHGGGGTHNQEDVGCPRGLQRLLHRMVRESLSEPDDIRPQQTAARAQRRQGSQRFLRQISDATSPSAASSRDVPVEFDHARTPCALVESVNVLGDERERRRRCLQSSQGPVPVVGVRGQGACPSVLVPFPHQLWISRKRLRCRQSRRIELSPPAISAPERGEAAFCGDPRTCERRQASCVPHYLHSDGHPFRRAALRSGFVSL